MHCWDLKKSKHAREELWDGLARARQHGLGEEDQQQAQSEVMASCTRLLLALGIKVSAAAVEEGATFLIASDRGTQKYTLATVKRAEAVEKLRREYADNWPCAVAPQHLLPRLGFGLIWCLLGASLIRFATLLGFPPFLWWLRFLLIMMHWVTAFAFVALASGWLSVGDFTAARTAFFFIGFLTTFVCYYGDKDLPGRQNAADKLWQGLKDARALKAKVRWLQRRSNRQQRQQLQGTALASLLTTLAACADQYIAEQAHAAQRLEEAKLSLQMWVRPFHSVR